MGRPHRTPHQTAGPPCAHCRRADRQHDQGRRESGNLRPGGIEGDIGSRNTRSVCACSTAAPGVWNPRPMAARCSTAAWRRSMSSGRASSTSSFFPTRVSGRSGSDVRSRWRPDSCPPSSIGLPRNIRTSLFICWRPNSAATYRALEERKVDLAIVGMYSPLNDAHLNAEVLFHEFFAVAAGRQSRWARRRSAKLAELVNERWTLPPSDTLFGSVVVEAFRASGLEVPRASVVTSSVPARIRLVATGRFLTALPRSMFRFHPKNAAIRILPIDLPTTRRPIGVITLKKRSLSPVAQLFIACARELAARSTQLD